jgi:hypothetical protein
MVIARSMDWWLPIDRQTFMSASKGHIIQEFNRPKFKKVERNINYWAPNAA